MEDMCQLTERLTEDKYHGSYEEIAKSILKFYTITKIKQHGTDHLPDAFFSFSPRF